MVIAKVAHPSVEERRAKGREHGNGPRFRAIVGGDRRMNVLTRWRCSRRRTSPENRT